MDLAPGEVVSVNLPSTAASFTGWIAHAEVGSGAEGGQAIGESGPDGPEGPESSGNEATMEAAMSSPITPLDQTWNGVLGGLAISASYDAATQTVHSAVQNTLNQDLCFVQAEPHLKSGPQTVGELGPDQLGDLSPGQQATSSISVSSEPNLAGASSTGTWSTWRCSTAAALARCLTQEHRELKAAAAKGSAARDTGPAAKVQAARAARQAARKAAEHNWPRTRPSMQPAAAPGWS